MTLWSFTRLVWGVATLYVYVFNIELLQDSNTPFWSFVVLILLFLVCEIIPIVALLDYSYLSMVGLESVEIRRTDDEHIETAARQRTSSSSTAAVVAALDPLFAISSPTSGRSIRWEDECADPLLSHRME
jgi:hypothetical protein